MKILIFDNYDSFTYNLVQAVEKYVSKKPDVFKNDCISAEEIDNYDHILISPGPGLPNESGHLLSMLKRYAATKSILGVCLGHQAIAETFGGKLENLKKVYHGVSTPIKILNRRESRKNEIFRNMPETMEAGRYHSWIVEKDSLPGCLEITAIDEEDQIMALRHKEYDIQSVQFHPESVLTPLGDLLIKNWLNV